ncbi:MAG: outer membrane protein assembly factor [bacterium]|nr:outer membrane protein assembly factor [bacterium]
MRNFDFSRQPTAPWRVFGEVYRKEAFHGNGETFAIDLSPGSEVNYGRLLYSHPDVFGTHFDRTGMTFEGVLRERRFSTHDEERLRGKLIVSRLFGQGDSSLRGGPIYQKLDVSDLDDDDVLPRELIDSADAGDQEFFGVNLDYRRSSLDNRLAPSSGHYFRLNNNFYGGPIGGDQDMIKSEANYDYYIQFGSEDDGVRPGAYLGLGAGVAHPYDDTDFVHYGERFFLGGSTHLRGFRFRRVGPGTEDAATGGETMVRGTLEYRQPLYATPIPGTSRRREMVRGILFVDWGILDPDSFELDPEELRISAGFGLGLTHPIPLAINFGWPLREGDNDELDVFSFRISYR